MRHMTPDFLAAQTADATPVVLASLSSDLGRRVVGVVQPDDNWLGEPLICDGAWTVGDGGTCGSNYPAVDGRTDARQFGTVTYELTSDTRNMLTSFSQAQIGAVTVTLDNTGGAWSLLVAQESFLGGRLTLLQGYAGLALSDFLTLWRGEITEITWDAGQMHVTAAAISATIFDTAALATTARYAAYDAEGELTSVYDTTSVLPLPYGDLLVNAGTEETDAGLWQCPCIDRETGTYCLAAFEIQSAAAGNTFAVYVDGERQDASDYTIDPAWEDASGETVAIVTFGRAVGNTVTAACRGRVSAGRLLTNPIDIIRDLAQVLGDETPIDPASAAVVRQTLDGYSAAGVIIASNSLAYYMTSILGSFLGAWWLNGVEAITFGVQNFDSTVLLNALALTLPGDKTTLTTAAYHASNRVQGLQLSYALSWANVDRRFKQGTNPKYRQEAVLGDETHLLPLALDWIRADADAEAIGDFLLTHYATAPLQATVTVAQLLCQIEQGDTVLFSSEAIRDDADQSAANWVGLVLTVEYDLDACTTRLSLLATGVYATTPPALADGSWTVGDDGYCGGAPNREQLY